MQRGILTTPASAGHHQRPDSNPAEREAELPRKNRSSRALVEAAA